MAKNKGLKTPTPVKSSFIYGSTGERVEDKTKIQKGGDLRNRPAKNNGAMK